MFRRNYGADFLNSIGTDSDMLIAGIAGRPTVMNPADIDQGAGGKEAQSAVNLARFQYDSFLTSGAATGTQATASVQGAQATTPDATFLSGLNPISTIQQWWAGVENDINRGLIGVLGIGIVLLAIYIFARD